MPNQPQDVSDKAIRVATNISCILSHDYLLDIRLSHTHMIARALDREYGQVNEPDVSNSPPPQLAVELL